MFLLVLFEFICFVFFFSVNARAHFFYMPNRYEYQKTNKSFGQKLKRKKMYFGFKKKERMLHMQWNSNVAFFFFVCIAVFVCDMLVSLEWIAPFFQICWWALQFNNMKYKRHNGFYGLADATQYTDGIRADSNTIFMNWSGDDDFSLFNQYWLWLLSFNIHFFLSLFKCGLSNNMVWALW